eukprot:sb/3460950/
MHPGMAPAPGGPPPPPGPHGHPHGPMVGLPPGPPNQLPPPTPIIPTTSPDNLKDKLLSVLGADDPVIMSFSHLSMEDIKTNVSNLIREGISEKVGTNKKLAVSQISATVQAPEVMNNPLRIRLLFGELGAAVRDGLLGGMEVCEALKELFQLNGENLTMELLTLYDGLIGHKDHKTCQEIFTVCFQQIDKLPNTLTVTNTRVAMVTTVKRQHLIITPFPGSHHRLAARLTGMIRKLLDRDTLVMPPLCSYCSLMIEYSKPDHYPHWSVNEMFNRYLGTFDSLIHLMTVENTEYLRPVIGHSYNTPTAWKLDQSTLRFHTADPNFFILRFQGPYAQPQLDLMKYTLKQPSCRDFVTNTMLNLRSGKGTVCPPLDKVYIQLIKDAVGVGGEGGGNSSGRLRILRNTAGEIGSLFVNRTIDLKHVWETLYAEMKRPSSTLLASLTPHRDYLMWTINSSLGLYLRMFKLQKKNFFFLCEVIKLLYPDPSPLPLPEPSPGGVLTLAAASVWTMLATRSFDNPGLQEPAPVALFDHISFLLAPHHTFPNDFTVCAALNHVHNFLINFASSPDSTSRPLRHLIDMICSSSNTLLLPGNVTVLAAQVPIAMSSLEMLTSHTKMNLNVFITNHIMRVANPQNTEPVSSCLTPALLETYGRLLPFPEVDCFCLNKMYMNMYNAMMNANAYPILAGLTEMFIHRLQYMHQTGIRVTMLTHLQTLSQNSQQRVGHQPQLLYLSESYIVRLMQLFSNHDHQRISSSTQNLKILSTSSEEINKIFLLSLAREAIVSGNRNTQLGKSFFDFMTHHTPGWVEWSPMTSKHFPPFIANYITNHPQNNPQQQQPGYPPAPQSQPPVNLPYLVTEEVNRVNQHGMKQDLAKHFREKDNNNIFLCLMLRKNIEVDVMPNYAAKVTSSWDAATMKQQLRNLVDFIVIEITNSKGSVILFSKISQILTNFVFNYHIVPFDTLILVLMLRKYTEQDAIIAYYLVFHLLVKRGHLKERVERFLSRASPEFWKIRDWTATHIDYHQKYPEHQYFVKSDFPGPNQGGCNYLPVYYTNLCLRFIPVLDLVLHRLIELKPKNNREWLILILKTYSGLFAFHDTPVRYLHDTLILYDSILSTPERELEKRVLIRCFLEVQPYKPLDAMTPQLVSYVTSEEGRWEVSRTYYTELLKKMNDALKEGADILGHVNWRFNEFTNPACLMLYLTSIELLAMPPPPTPPQHGDPISAHRLAIGHKLVETALTSRNPEMYNTVSLVFSALPFSFSKAVFARIADLLADPTQFYSGTTWSSTAQSLLLLTHSFLQHCKNDCVDYIPEFITQNSTHLQTECQVVYVFKLFSPFLRHWDRNTNTRKQILYSLYQVMFSLLSENSASNPDLFVDFMYFIKYVFVGDEFKTLLERHLPTLPTDVASKLKFCGVEKSD